LTRTSRFFSVETEIIPDVKNTKNLSESEQKQREGALIEKAIQAGDTVVLLDERGSEYPSVEFADWLQRKLCGSGKRLVFVIGGAYGFSPAVYAAAHERLSLSKMTFSHQMIRLLFVEQLYRAATILNGLPYHHA
jgi:23S rRNA (pseudouridine1915-N3)-methyltransferase